MLAIKENRHLKGLVIVLVLLSAFLLIKYAKSNSENKSLEEAYEQKLQDEIESKETVIKDLKSQIKFSKETISDLESRQDQYEHSLDSLSALKRRIKTIYIDRIVEVETFNATEVENYWKNKFSIDE